MPVRPRQITHNCQVYGNTVKILGVSAHEDPVCRSNAYEGMLEGIRSRVDWVCYSCDPEKRIKSGEECPTCKKTNTSQAHSSCPWSGDDPLFDQDANTWSCHGRTLGDSEECPVCKATNPALK